MHPDFWSIGLLKDKLAAFIFDASADAMSNNVFSFFESILPLVLLESQNFKLFKEELGDGVNVSALL